MGLFDDILKKPAPAANPPSDPLIGGAPTGGQTGGQTSGSSPSPNIVKTDGGTIFGAETEAVRIQELNKPPQEAQVHAEEDSSSILMPTPGQTSTPIAPIAPVSEQIVVAAPEVPNTPIAMTMDTPTNTLSQETPMSQPIQTIAQETTAQAPSAFISNEAPTQVTSPGTTPVESSNQDALQVPAGPSLFDHILREDEVTTPVTSAPVGDPADQVLASTPAVSAPVMTQVQADTMVSTAGATTSGFSSPREFIEKSLDNIDTMLHTIDSKHTSKMTEAEGYRMEKMRFSELEKNAYAEAEIMDRERDHTLRMKSIFEKELEADEANRTKRSSNSEASSEKHMHVTHKKHVHEEEEELVAAS